MIQGWLVAAIRFGLKGFLFLSAFRLKKTEYFGKSFYLFF
jgi:hypothetical protein